ncbi:MAG: hypothetical protein C4529_08930 [Deltaproteobacteria bacterium]|nr:MAG: hypothetical protein C4529_08930 [Deltaproteobacteria bacterium]
MRTEILAAKGLLAEQRRKTIDLDIEAKGLITHIRSVLSPYEEDVTVLRVEEAASSVRRLLEIVGQMKEIKGKIAKLEADLGREA